MVLPSSAAGDGGEGDFGAGCLDGVVERIAFVEAGDFRFVGEEDVHVGEKGAEGAPVAVHTEGVGEGEATWRPAWRAARAAVRKAAWAAGGSKR